MDPLIHKGLSYGNTGSIFRIKIIEEILVDRTVASSQLLENGCCLSLTMSVSMQTVSNHSGITPLTKHIQHGSMDMADLKSSNRRYLPSIRRLTIEGYSGYGLGMGLVIGRNMRGIQVPSPVPAI